jgi:hypothetical protein
METELKQPIQRICINCKNHIDGSCSRGFSGPERLDRCTTDYTKNGNFASMQTRVVDPSNQDNFVYAEKVIRLGPNQGSK